MKGIKSKNKQEESGKPMARLSEQRKNKKQTQSNHIKKSRIFNAGVARLGIIEVLGRPNGPSILAVHSKERKEIVQYHPSRGRP